MELPATILAGRRRAGLTQAQVAAIAGTSQSAVAAYERGRKSPNLTTLAQIAAAVGATLHIDFVSPADDERRERPIGELSMEERRSLWLYRAVAAAIQADPARAEAVARANVAVLRGRDVNGRREPWRCAWEALLDGPLDTLLAALCSTSTYASQLRQTAPYGGLLTVHERWAVYGMFRKAEVEARLA